MILIDTSIFVRLPNDTDPLLASAESALEHLRESRERLVVAPQCLYEFWVVVTRPLQNNGYGFTSSKAAWWLDHIQNMANLLTDDLDIYYYLEDLVRSRTVLGHKGHDAHMVAWMHRHNVTRILTFNAKDFARYGIAVIDPRNL